MRINISLLILLLNTTCVFSQVTFEKTIGRPDIDYGYSVAQANDGGYIVAGYTYNYETGSSDVYLVRKDALGDTVWTRSYGGPVYNQSYSVAQTKDNGYILSGYTHSYGAGGYDVYLIKTNDHGDTLWTKTYGGVFNDYGNCVVQTSDGGYIIAGVTSSFGNGGDIYLIRTDEKGDTLWTETYGGTEYDQANSVVQMSDGGYVITGTTNSFGAGDYDAYVIRTDANGKTLWTKTYGGKAEDRGNSISLTADGGMIITGYTFSYGAGSCDVYLIKTDSEGNTIWTKTFGGADTDQGYSVVQTTDGGYIITGYSNSFKEGINEVYLIKTDGLGNVNKN